MKRFVKIWAVNLMIQIGIILSLKRQIRPIIPDHFGLDGPDSFVAGSLFSVLGMVLVINVAALLFLNLPALLVTRVPVLAQHQQVTQLLCNLLGFWTLGAAWTTLPWCFLPAALWMVAFMNGVDLIFLVLFLGLLVRRFFKMKR